jgi:hypothetical protein
MTRAGRASKNGGHGPSYNRLLLLAIGHAPRMIAKCLNT